MFDRVDSTNSRINKGKIVVKLVLDDLAVGECYRKARRIISGGKRAYLYVGALIVGAAIAQGLGVWLASRFEWGALWSTFITVGMMAIVAFLIVWTQEKYLKNILRDVYPEALPGLLEISKRHYLRRILLAKEIKDRFLDASLDEVDKITQRDSLSFLRNRYKSRLAHDESSLFKKDPFSLGLSALIIALTAGAAQQEMYWKSGLLLVILLILIAVFIVNYVSLLFTSESHRLQDIIDALDIVLEELGD